MQNYTVLPELNWSALLSCGVNAIKYFHGDVKEYKRLTKEMEKGNEVYNLLLMQNN